MNKLFELAFLLFSAALTVFLFAILLIPSATP